MAEIGTIRVPIEIRVECEEVRLRAAIETAVELLEADEILSAWWLLKKVADRK